MSEKMRAFGFSVLVHLFVLGVLALSMSHKPQPLGTTPAQPEAVEAVVVDDTRVQAELKRLKSSERAQRRAEEARKRRAQKELDKARREKEAETKRLATLKQKREQEQREAEQQRKQLAQLEKEKTLLEQKRQQEQQRLAEAEGKRKKEEARAARLENERKLRAEMEAEQKRLANERKQRLAGRQNLYLAAIQSKVRRNWLRPAGSAEDFLCVVSVKQLPDGTVVQASVTKSCGNPALDRSVEAAVLKASPLPTPDDPDLFDRELEIKFRPQ